MKEATGELNMTVITVVAIAAIGLLFTTFVWPNIQASITLNTACTNLDAKGNYNATTTGGQNEDGTAVCGGWSCTTTYGGRTFTKNCRTNG